MFSSSSENWNDPLQICSYEKNDQNQDLNGEVQAILHAFLYLERKYNSDTDLILVLYPVKTRKRSIPEMTVQLKSEDHCIANVLCIRYTHYLLSPTVL